MGCPHHQRTLLTVGSTQCEECLPAVGGITFDVLEYKVSLTSFKNQDFLVLNHAFDFKNTAWSEVKVCYTYTVRTWTISHQFKWVSFKESPIIDEHTCYLCRCVRFTFLMMTTTQPIFFKPVVLKVGSLRWFQGVPSKKGKHLFSL